MENFNFCPVLTKGKPQRPEVMLGQCSDLILRLPHNNVRFTILWILPLIYQKFSKKLFFSELSLDASGIDRNDFL